MGGQQKGFQNLMYLVVILGVLGINNHLQAATEGGLESLNTTQEKIVADDLSAKPKRISVVASLRESSNLISPGSAGHENQTQIDLSLGFLLADWGKISVIQGVTKAHQREEELAATNTKIGLRHLIIPVHREVGIINGVYTKLPANEKTREKDRLRVALGLENLIDIRLGQGPILITNRLVLNKNFHEYTINAFGVPTIEWSLNESVTILGEIASIVSLSVDASYLTNRTYRGITKSRLDFSEEIALQISKQFALTLGHTNGDDLVNSSERSSSLTAFDDANSTVYGVISFIY